MLDKAVYNDQLHTVQTNITLKICDEAYDDSLAILKLIPDWFVSS